MPRYPVHDRWQSWEIEVAHRLNGSRVKASGRFDMFKGDVKTARVLVDCKYTEGSGYTLTEEMWETLSDWARNESREPVLAVQTNNADIAVVSEPFYWELAKIEPRKVTTLEAKSKRINAKMLGDAPTQFQIGCYTLMAYSFDKFEEDLNEVG